MEEEGRIVMIQMADCTCINSCTKINMLHDASFPQVVVRRDAVSWFLCSI